MPAEVEVVVVEVEMLPALPDSFVVPSHTRSYLRCSAKPRMGLANVTVFVLELLGDGGLRESVFSQASRSVGRKFGSPLRAKLHVKVSPTAGA